MWILTVPTLLYSFTMIILVVDHFTHRCPQVVPARIQRTYKCFWNTFPLSNVIKGEKGKAEHRKVPISSQQSRVFQCSVLYIQTCVCSQLSMSTTNVARSSQQSCMLRHKDLCACLPVNLRMGLPHTYISMGIHQTTRNVEVNCAVVLLTHAQHKDTICCHSSAFHV